MSLYFLIPMLSSRAQKLSPVEKETVHELTFRLVAAGLAQGNQFWCELAFQTFALIKLWTQALLVWKALHL